MSNLQGVIDSKSHPPVLVAKTGDWHPAYIKFRLDLAGHSFAELSRLKRRRDGRAYSRTWAHLALYRPHAPGEAAIASAIGVAPLTIWPSRYNADGTPRRGRVIELPRKSISAPAQRNGERGQRN